MKRTHTIRGWEGRLPLPALSLLLALLLAAACGPDQAGGPKGHSLIIGIGRDLYYGPDDRTYLHGSTHTWEGLTYLGGDLRPRPWLAESWSSSGGGRVWDFFLRPGVRFHDGTPFTAADAVFCIERLRRNPKYDPVKQLPRPDEGRGRWARLHLRFSLSKTPAPFFPALVAQYNSPMIKPSAV